MISTTNAYTFTTFPNSDVGTIEAFLIDQIHSRQHFDGNPSWDLRPYMKWRDTWGVSREAWNGLNFGATEHEKYPPDVEYYAGSTLTLEAGIHCYESNNVENFVSAMLSTMFKDRTVVSPDAVLNPKTNKKEIDCQRRDVVVSPVVDLSFTDLMTRLNRINTPTNHNFIDC